jgi:hypothetical protein
MPATTKRLQRGYVRHTGSVPKHTHPDCPSAMFGEVGLGTAIVDSEMRKAH